MSDTVAEIYDEAAAIAQDSPRAAAALLRLCLETMFVEQGVGKAGDKLDARIGQALAEGLISERIQKAADFVRVSGNEAVHPGQIADDDQPAVGNLFALVNLIVHRLVTEPAQVNALYESLPDDKLDGIENRNAQAQKRIDG